MLVNSKSKKKNFGAFGTKLKYASFSSVSCFSFHDLQRENKSKYNGLNV